MAGSSDQLEEVLERLEALEQGSVPGRFSAPDNFPATASVTGTQRGAPLPGVGGSAKRQRQLQKVGGQPEDMAEGWLTIGQAFELARSRGYTKSLSAFRMMAEPSNPEKTPPEPLYAAWGFEIDLKRRGGSGQRLRWLRSLPGFD